MTAEKETLDYRQQITDNRHEARLSHLESRAEPLAKSATGIWRRGAAHGEGTHSAVPSAWAAGLRQNVVALLFPGLGGPLGHDQNLK